MKYFAPVLAVSALALASAALGYQYCGDKSASDGTVIMAKTPLKSKGMVVAANPYATQAGVEI